MLSDFEACQSLKESCVILNFNLRGPVTDTLRKAGEFWNASPYEGLLGFLANQCRNVTFVYKKNDKE